LDVGQAFNFPWRIGLRFLWYYLAMAKPIRVGFDFDGVIAYNPARLARLPVSFVKKHILRVRTDRFFVPKNFLERAFWSLAHESSMFPSLGAARLRSLVASGLIEAHVVTSRFGFLEPNLRRFLSFWNLSDVFASVTINHKEEQPHEFKARIIRVKKFAFFVEDNWDIVSHLTSNLPLQTGKQSTEIHWIYNLLDRKKKYPYKYPYLAKSLERIVGVSKVKDSR